MTPQELLLAAHQWKATHQLVHGALNRAEIELVNELIEFLVNCAQTYEPVYPSGVPMSSDLP